MPIAINKNTTQAPMSTLGLTGAQSIQWIPAPRVYLKVADVQTATPVQDYYTKSNGATPLGWTDLGIVDGKAVVTYTKKTTQIKTGIDNYLRQEYVSEKSGQLVFSLSQFDDVALTQISGLTASTVTSGSTINFQIGQEDLNYVALLLVCQNKLDSKEWQFYNPAAIVNFTFDETATSLVLKCTATLPFFTAAGQTTESLLSLTEFA